MSSKGASADADTGLVVPVICGPTAAGKSAVALRLAERHDVTIISADSRQIYRRFDLGTAKPDAGTVHRVPHRGIDVAEPTERYSAAAWAELAGRAVAEAAGAGRIPLVVGGTGFYIRALVQPLFREPVLDASRRLAVQAAIGSLELDELRRWCLALDPARAHLGRAQLSRAIEVALLTGRRLSDLHVERARVGMFRASYLLVDPGPVLGSWIAARASAMLEAGWLEEVRALMADVPEDAPAWHATGYDVLRRHARGELSRGAALERVIVETRQYAKRQRTWFRNQLAGEDVRRIVPHRAGAADAAKAAKAANATGATEIVQAAEAGGGDSGWEDVVDSWMTEIEAGFRGAGIR